MGTGTQKKQITATRIDTLSHCLEIERVSAQVIANTTAKTTASTPYSMAANSLGSDA